MVTFVFSTLLMFLLSTRPLSSFSSVSLSCSLIYVCHMKAPSAFGFGPKQEESYLSTGVLYRFSGPVDQVSMRYASGEDPEYNSRCLRQVLMTR